MSRVRRIHKPLPVKFEKVLQVVADKAKKVIHRPTKKKAAKT